MKSMSIWTSVVLVLAVMAFVPATVDAQTETRYFCEDDGNWATAANWNTNSDCSSGSTGVPDGDDHAVILEDLTCEMNATAGNCSDITVESGAVVNINSGKTLKLKGDPTASSTITGTINLEAATSMLSILDNDHTLTGGGKIIGLNESAEIFIDSNETLTSEIIIEGILTISDGTLNPGTFRNEKTVDANGSGTLLIDVEHLEDAAGATWQVTASSATLNLDITNGTADTLSGDFTVTAGVLDIDPPGFETSGVLTFTGGTIDCRDFTGLTVAKFTGTPS